MTDHDPTGDTPTSLPPGGPLPGAAAPGRLEHVATVVPDLERAMAFYGTLLGLERAGTVRLTDHTIGYLSDGSGVLVELIDFDDGGPGTTREPTMEGLHHMAWSVPDVAAAARRAAELGGAVTSGPTVVDKLGFISALVEDPLGREIELLQWLPGRGGAARSTQR
ncbi:MAG: VOC family protein [Actinomyces sp.]|uniref:VOC family protein n=1 Tax=Actinomyces sp. TaxID=29317 RepID=UPI0026DCD677|nr:VOC family protein [Actinomyces sp.]MDO4242447.1 VOC family protein [Actinomyces sp.]